MPSTEAAAGQACGGESRDIMMASIHWNKVHLSSFRAISHEKTTTIVSRLMRLWRSEPQRVVVSFQKLKNWAVIIKITKDYAVAKVGI